MPTNNHNTPADAIEQIRALESKLQTARVDAIREVVRLLAIEPGNIRSPPDRQSGRLLFQLGGVLIQADPGNIPAMCN